jgi:NAD(P)-dependent dehydrogenase (short-subunit alcohol dehydrogenase family)
MSKKYALVTGGRTKIGNEIAISLLRNGTTVYLTTRFPKDTLERMAQQPDYESWKDRVYVACVDFKVPESIVEFCEWLGTQIPYLDIIINNAC